MRSETCCICGRKPGEPLHGREIVGYVMHYYGDAWACSSCFQDMMYAKHLMRTVETLVDGPPDTKGT